jgi:hypothetical protein
VKLPLWWRYTGWTISTVTTKLLYACNATCFGRTRSHRQANKTQKLMMTYFEQYYFTSSVCLGIPIWST